MKELPGWCSRHRVCIINWIIVFPPICRPNRIKLKRKLSLVHSEVSWKTLTLYGLVVLLEKMSNFVFTIFTMSFGPFKICEPIRLTAPCTRCYKLAWTKMVVFDNWYILLQGLKKIGTSVLNLKLTE